jgi:hypothetical protein
MLGCRSRSERTLRRSKGNKIDEKSPACNMGMYWDGDFLSDFDGTTFQNGTGKIRPPMSFLMLKSFNVNRITEQRKIRLWLQIYLETGVKK